jgi:2,4-dienoyl-CoA reductase-like NADH-dependent reductase (Old Yellow Enzyme family)
MQEFEEIEKQAAGESEPDFFGFGRALVCCPGLPSLIRRGQLDTINWCTCCDRCFEAFDEHRSVRCEVFPPDEE